VIEGAVRAALIYTLGAEGRRIKRKKNVKCLQKKKTNTVLWEEVKRKEKGEVKKYETPVHRRLLH